MGNVIERCFNYVLLNNFNGLVKLETVLRCEWYLLFAPWFRLLIVNGGRTAQFPLQ